MADNKLYMPKNDQRTAPHITPPRDERAIVFQNEILNYIKEHPNEKCDIEHLSIVLGIDLKTCKYAFGALQRKKLI